jgi:hypothetical protein
MADSGPFRPEALSPKCVSIEGSLTQLESAYRKVMLESDRTESELVADYLVAHGDDVLGIIAQARELESGEATEWLEIIRRRIDRLVHLRRSR